MNHADKTLAKKWLNDANDHLLNKVTINMMKQLDYPDVVCRYIKENWIKMNFLDDDETYYVTVKYYNKYSNTNVLDRTTTQGLSFDPFIITGSEKVCLSPSLKMNTISPHYLSDNDKQFKDGEKFDISTNIGEQMGSLFRNQFLKIIHNKLEE